MIRRLRPNFGISRLPRPELGVFRPQRPRQGVRYRRDLFFDLAAAYASTIATEIRYFQALSATNFLTIATGLRYFQTLSLFRLRIFWTQS